MCSQVKPIRSSAPGREVLDQHVALLDQRSSTALPFGFFASTVIERLLWFSIVK